MNLDKFKIFLQNLGFSEEEISEIREGVFIYKLPISEMDGEEVIYAYTPTSDEVFKTHKCYWNRNNTNNFVAVGDEETYIINAKAKPNANNPTSPSIRIKSFNYGVNTKGFEREKVALITKDSIDATYYFEFIINNRKKGQEVDKDLLLNLIALRNDLLKIKDDHEAVHLLILRCLFVKYLEDKGIFKENYLIDALASQQTSKLIETFEEIKKINGDIFKFDRNSLEDEIDNGYLGNLYRFFTSDYRSGQTWLFPYLFDQIPIQLISNVYEAFLHNEEKQERGIYYTPSFLVNFILSHSLKDKLTRKKNVTVFDPAVGSGAFLVESFKEIVNAQGASITFDRKKEILQNQLFGVDVDENALHIAAFSLYLALIETEDPGFIRDKIENSHPILPSLIGKNLIRANAIAEEVFKDRTFDCIVSNPPWGSAESNENAENKKEREAIGNKGEVGTMPIYQNVSDFERSQAFLIRVGKWGHEKTIFSLVVKNSIFLNDNSANFRRQLLDKYQINQFYELSNYNKILFKKHKIGEIDGKRIVIGASEPCAVLVFASQKDKDHKIKYISPKLNEFSENFQVIHYTGKDINEVEQSKFIEDDLLWRVLVNGDLEDYKLIKNKLVIENSLTIECRSGFQPKADMKSLGEPVWKKIIEPTDFERYLIKNQLGEFNWNQELHRRRDEEIFRGNRILIPAEQLKVDEKRLRGIRLSDEIVFKDNVLCLKFKDETGYIENYCPYLAVINSKLIGYYFHNVSAQWGKGKTFNTIRNVDIEKLPIFPIPQNSPIYKKLNDLVLDVENLKFNGQSSDEIENQIDEIVFDLYGLKEYEKEIIREFYQIRVERAEKKESFVTNSDIKKYISKFIEVFSLMIDKDHRLVATQYHISVNAGAAICFTIVNDGEDDLLDSDRTLEILDFVKRQQFNKADTSKILNEEKVKIYDGKFLYIVKSKFFKDWSIRQAIKDAREEVAILLSKLPQRHG